MQIGILVSPNSGAELTRDGQTVGVDQGGYFSWGDLIKNNSSTPMEIDLTPLALGQGRGRLVVQPGASARLEALISEAVGGPSRTKVIALGDGVELFDVADAPSPAVLEKQEESEESAVGLFGAGLFSGGGTFAAFAGAVGVGLVLDQDDEDSSGPSNTENAAGLANGLAGGVESLGDGVNQTSLAPLTGITDPVADILAMVGGALASADAPLALGDLLGAVIGDPASDAGASNDGGLVGLVNAVSTGLDEAFAVPPLDALSPLINPLTQTLGSSSGVTDGVAQGLANLGSSLTNDSSFLGPLTSDLLGPLVGNSSGQDGGLPQTLDQVSEGLTDLTNPSSALVPLDALTQPVGGVIEGLADVVDELGNALAQPAAQDPSGLLGLVVDILGGEVQPLNSAAGNGNPLFLFFGLPG